MDEDLDSGHEVSLGLASLWLGVALGPPWPNISKCSTHANSLGSYCPLSPHDEDTMLMHKSLETDLPLGSSRRPLFRVGNSRHSHSTPISDERWKTEVGSMCFAGNSADRWHIGNSHLKIHLSSV